MKRLTIALLISLCSVSTAPLLAQTTIGGGSCTSASVSGVYALSISGRQVNSSGAFTNVFQANGTATFDGLSKVNVSLTSDTNQAVATQLTWSGTYSIQANCVGVLNITTGGSASFNIELYNVIGGNGPAFVLTGNDATYGYTGNGNNQPTGGCSSTPLSGVYTFNATGFVLNGSSVSGAENGAGLLQFDGQGHITVNVTVYASGTPSVALTLTGSYSLSSNCLGTANLTDSSSNAYVMNFSISDATRLYSSNVFVSLARASRFIIIGSAHAIYNQPALSAGLFSARVGGSI